jgi:hypothetical protein
MSDACGGVGRRDRVWVEAAQEAGVMEKCESPHGKTAEQTKRAQKHSVGMGLAKTAGETALEATSMAAHGGLALAAGALSVVVTGFAHVTALYESIAEAAELKDAYARDAVNLAVIWTGSAALPHDYVAHMGHELRAVGGERGGAMKILNRLMKDDTRWQALKARTESHIRIGQKVAAKLGLDSRGAVEERVRKDPRFAKAYSQNLAFKHGVDSHVFLQEQRRMVSGN